MRTLTIFLLALVSVQSAFPISDRWNELMKLVTQEMRLLERAKRKGVEIKYRMLELYSEKLKLIHEKNNSEFMASASKVSGKDKESYFKETRKFYLETKEFGQKILREEVKNGRRAEILFALALNSRDYGRDQVTEKYLLEAIQLASGSSLSLKHHAETALADFYYNEKRYPEAIRYYQTVILNQEDEWVTKHLFNLSWCYLKNRQFPEAIEAIRKSYFESRNPRHVNMRDQVLDNIGSFYVYAGRPMDGLEFYLGHEKNPLPYLLAMATKTSEKGHQTETKAILDAAQAVILKNKLSGFQEELFHAYLDFYRQYNRFFDHEITAERLVSYYSNPQSEKKLMEDAVEKLRTTAGYLQLKLSKDVKKGEASFDQQELEILLRYFSHLISLDQKRKPGYLYFRAETYFSINRFTEAAHNYVASVLEAKGSGETEQVRKSLNSLLALLADDNLDAGSLLKHLIFAYQEYLEHWPRDDKSFLIYPKLFEIFREQGDDQNAARVISLFNKSYPEYLKDQQAQMTKILDFLIEKKETEKINSWIMSFKGGFLSFPKETIEKTEIILGNLLFMQYQELAKKGERLRAAEGFAKLYAHKLYPNKVKSEAAFFAAMAYLDAGETKLSYKWQSLAHLVMTEEEKFKRRSDQLKMSERIYKLQDFTTSARLSAELLKKYCDQRDETQDRFYEIAIMTSLVDETPEDAEETVTNFSRCLLKKEVRTEALSQIYQFHEKHGDFYGLRLFVKRHPLEAFKERYLSTLQKWFWERTDLNLKDQIKEDFRQSKSAEAATWLTEIKTYEEAQKEAQEILAVEIWKGEAFDARAFNHSLEGYLLRTKKFKDKFQGLLTSSQENLTILAARLFSELFAKISTKIRGLHPGSTDETTLAQVRLTMVEVARPFQVASDLYARNLDKALTSKETLLWGKRVISSIEGVENPIYSFHTGLTMDRGQE